MTNLSAVPLCYIEAKVPFSAAVYSFLPSPVQCCPLPAQRGEQPQSPWRLAQSEPVSYQSSLLPYTSPSSRIISTIVLLYRHIIVPTSGPSFSSNTPCHRIYTVSVFGCFLSYFSIAPGQANTDSLVSSAATRLLDYLQFHEATQVSLISLFEINTNAYQRKTLFLSGEACSVENTMLQTLDAISMIRLNN